MYRCTYTSCLILRHFGSSSCFFSLFALLLSHRLHRLGSWMGDDIMEKAFTWTLCFDDSRISQIQYSVNNKATVNVSWVCFSYSFIISIAIIGMVQGAYIHIGVRLSRCSFRQSWAMREPLNREASDRCWLHVFSFKAKQKQRLT